VAPFRIAANGDRDSMPVVVKEAMIRAKAVVGTDVAGIPEMLDDGCGVLVPPDDPTALGDAIAALLSDDRLRDELGVRARRRGQAHYLLDDCARDMERVLRRLLGL
jgi:glycosyltransferase involved in cell wall biosynthesis